MKNILTINSYQFFKTTIATLWVLSVLFSGCGEKSENNSIEPILVIQQSLNFSESASSETLDITSNTKWTITISDPSWLTCSLAAGEGNQTVTISVIANEAFEARSVTLTVTTTEGAITQPVQVTQEGKPEEFCSFVNSENIDKTIPVINEHLSSLYNGWDDGQKLTVLAAWLKSQPCIIEASVVKCQSCDETMSRAKEITVSFDENGTIKDYILSFSTNNQLKATGYHEYESWRECRNELFYYTQQKVFLDFPILNDWLVVGFIQEAQDEEILSFINQTGLFRPVYERDIWYRAEWDGDIHLMWVNTKEPKTCSQLKEIIHTLEKETIVSYAYICFETVPHSRDPLEWGTVYISSFSHLFFVEVKDVDDLTDLYSVMQETNTWLLRQDQFMPQWFTLWANKHSKGNALQMSQYFYETEKFEAVQLFDVIGIKVKR